MYSSQQQPTSKLHKYMTSIRRQARHKIIDQMRNNLYFETKSIDKIAQQFRIVNKKTSQLQILQILSLQYQQLMNVSNKINNMNEQKNEISISAHVDFWAYLLQEIYNDKIVPDQKLYDFFLQFIQRNKYVYLSKQPTLQNKVLNTLQISLIPENAPKKLKNSCLRWVAGTQALTLIYNSVSTSFLSPDQYQNIYQIMSQAIQMQKFEKLQQSCEILMIILKEADYDDVHRIYIEQSHLMVSLVAAIQKWVQIRDVNKCGYAIQLLMDTYDNLILDYARMGVALLAVRMITSKRQNNVLTGLQIIKYISQIQSTQAIKFLLEDRELNEFGLWKYVLNKVKSQNSQNIVIKRQCLSILCNMMLNGDYTCNSIINSKSKQINNQELIELVTSLLKNQEDVTVLLITMKIFSNLLYYSQNFTKGDEDEDFGQNIGNKNYRQNFLKQFQANIIHLQIDKQLDKLLIHQNKQIVQHASKLCQSVQYIIGANK